MDNSKFLKRLSNIYGLVVFVGILLIGLFRYTEATATNSGEIAVKILLLSAFICSLIVVLKYKYLIPFDVRLNESRIKFLSALGLCAVSATIAALSLVQALTQT
jgi:hypothetical protein